MNANDIHLDDELAQLLPQPTEVQLTCLRESLRAEGLRDALLVWVTGGRRVLVDGYTRLKLARELGIDIRCEEKAFADRDAAIEYRITGQVARRNLCPLALAYYCGRVYEIWGKRQGARTDLTSGQTDSTMTARGVGIRFGVSERSVRRNAALVRAIDLLGSPEYLGPAFKDQLLGGKTNLTRRGILQLARMSAAERQRVLARLEREREERRSRPRRKPAAPKAAGSTSSNADTPVAVQTTHSHDSRAGQRDAALVARRSAAVAAACEPAAAVQAGELPPDIRLHHADNRTFDWPDIDLCFTDPPYQDLDGYSWLGEMLGRKLRPGRLALVYASPFHLPEVIGRLTGGGLRYVTTFGIVYRLACGGKPLHGFISSNIRPVVVLSRGKAEGVGRLVHAAQVQEPSPKGLHPWQQAVEPAVEWVRRLTRPGELVADPFLGSGTTAMAVRQIGGLRFVGTEIDPNTYNTARHRVATEVPTNETEPGTDTAAVEGLLARWRELDPQTKLGFLCRPVVQAAIQRLNAREERE